MRCNAYVLTCGHHGKVEQLEVAAIADDNLLVRVLAAPLTQTDYDILLRPGEGSYIPGSALLGSVEKAGTAATEEYGVVEGDMVYVAPSIACLLCKPCLTGNYSACAKQLGYGKRQNGLCLRGGTAEYAIISPGSRVHKLKTDLPMQTLSMLPLAEKAVAAVINKGGGEIGKSLLVLEGGLFGLICAKLAKDAGLHPVKLLAEALAPDLTGLAQEADIELIHNLGEENFDIIISAGASKYDADSLLSCINPLGDFVLTTDGKFSASSYLVLSRQIKITGVGAPSWSFGKAMLFLTQNHACLQKLAVYTYPLSGSDKAFADGISKRGHIVVMPWEEAEKGGSSS